jgi:hypothetical protein
VWVEGERRFYYVARLCKSCNHRHGEEEICYCRYIEKGEEPKQWMPIRDMWLFKVGGKSQSLLYLPFREWCSSTGPPSHGHRQRCSRFCVGGR